METLSLIGNAFAGMMNPMSILLLIVGVAVGIVFGSIPGLSAAMAVALFLPVTFAMQAHEAFTLLVALYIGGISGGLSGTYNMVRLLAEERREIGRAHV